MDKYQEYIFKNSNSYYGLSVCGKSDLEKVIFEDKIIFKQNEDIMITDYVFYIANIGIESVLSITDGKETPLKQESDPQRSRKNRFFLHVSFDDKIDAIKIIFKNNLADDLTFPVTYVYADKEKFYAKREKERKEKLIKKANIKVTTGADLVNIYFQPCCNDYARTEIILYKDDMMIAKYKVNAESFFKSISGLAYGKYMFTLKQLDSKENILIETAKKAFIISAPEIDPDDFIPYTVI